MFLEESLFLKNDLLKQGPRAIVQQREKYGGRYSVRIFTITDFMNTLEFLSQCLKQTQIKNMLKSLQCWNMK